MSRTAELLNGLLADAVVYYYKLHNYHWFVTGDRFKELHERFEELYENAHTDIDDLAERVLTVGGRPIGTLKGALEHAAIKEETGTPDAATMIGRTIADLRTRLERIHQTAEAADSAHDRGTAALMDDLTSRIEKSIWMLEASKAR
jgi:starvation-inducible DNA-binding protein